MPSMQAAMDLFLSSAMYAVHTSLPARVEISRELQVRWIPEDMRYILLQVRSLTKKQGTICGVFGTECPKMDI